MPAVGEKNFQRIFLHSENFDTFMYLWVDMHNNNICVHSNSRALTTTSWKVTCTIDRIKIGEIFVPIQSMNLWQKF